MVHFFFFGCWNRDNCDGIDYRKGLFNTITPIGHIFDFGIIAGDNVYPHDKRYYQSTLDYGFGMLDSLRKKTRGKQVFATIGNHDVNRKDVLRYQIESPVITMPTNMYAYKPTDYLRIIFIDTNIFTRKKSPFYKETFRKKSNKDEFEEFFKVKNEEETLAELDKILKLDPHYTGWTIVVGHEPIFSIKPKQKEGKSSLKINSWIPYENLFNKLSAIPKTVYMCADVHTFQAWNIHAQTEILPTVVAGTGGGEPDDILPEKMVYHIDKQRMDLLSSEYPYGFCEVICTQNDLDIIYKPLKGCTTNQKTIHLKYLNNHLEIAHKIRDSGNTKCNVPITETQLCQFHDAKEMEGGRRKNKK